jgi:hypothetical protein
MMMPKPKARRVAILVFATDMMSARCSDCCKTRRRASGKTLSEDMRKGSLPACECKLSVFTAGNNSNFSRERQARRKEGREAGRMASDVHKFTGL